MTFSRILNIVLILGAAALSYVVIHQEQTISRQRTVMIEMYDYITQGCPQNPYAVGPSATN